MKKKVKVSKLSNWMFYKKIAIELWWITLKNRIQRRRHCNKGFHNFASGSTITVNHKNQEIRSDYITCRTCETYFFPTQKDKANFIRQKEQHREFMRKAVETMVKETTKRKDVKVVAEGKIGVKEFK